MLAFAVNGCFGTIVAWQEAGFQPPAAEMCIRDRHCPDQVQGDPKLRFVSISAEDAPQRPCFYVQTYYTRPPLIVKPFKFYPHDSPQVLHAFFNVLSSVPGIL